MLIELDPKKCCRSCTFCMHHNCLFLSLHPFAHACASLPSLNCTSTVSFLSTPPTYVTGSNQYRFLDKVKLNIHSKLLCCHNAQQPACCFCERLPADKHIVILILSNPSIITKYYEAIFLDKAILHHHFHP